jgi:outer membrane protein insertion porin family
MPKKLITLMLLLITAASVRAQIKLGGDTVISYSSPQEYTIGGIEVTGTQYMDKKVLAMISGLSEGDKIQVPGSKISEAIDNLWRQGLFDDVQILKTRITGHLIFLEIRVLERPKLRGFEFAKGVSKSDQDDLREKMRLVTGMPYTDYVEGSIKEIVREFYVDKGYLNAKVDTIIRTPDTLLPNHVRIKILVKKCSKVRIREVEIHGNEALKDGQLRRVMKDTKRRRWYSFFNSSKFLEETYARDKEKVIEKYKARGYRDARIVKDTVYRVSDDGLNIEIVIDEGPKYYFRNITFVGNSKYSSKDLHKILNIRKGDVFNQELLDARLYMNPNGYDISSLYMDDGYLFFQVMPVEVMVENDSIDLEIRISEGKQATINKVTVVGNTKTNDHVIMREIRTKPGQLFRRSDIIRTQRELAQLGYFDNEKLSVNPKPNPASGTVDIEYIVEEKPSDQIELSGGWGGGRVVGTLGLSFNNFSARQVFKAGAWRPLPAGDGQRLSIRAQSTGLFYQSYNFSFTEPWLGGKKPNSLSISVYRSMFSNGRPKKIEVNGEQVINPARESMIITGGSVGLGKRLKWPDDYFTLYLEGSYQHYELNNYRSIFVFNTGQANNVFGRLNVSRNSIDDPIFPRSGSQVSFSAQLTPPWSLFSDKDYSTLTPQEKFRLVEYQKYKVTASWFTQLTNKKSKENEGKARNLVLNARAGFGFLGMYNTQVGLSPFERFYLGGSGLTGLNGFDGREIIALRGYDDGSVSPQTGAAFISKYTLEVRYPISLNPQATIFALGFAEAGNSWEKARQFNPFEVKRSAGVGLRIFLPMFGLLGLDYGWRFDDVPGRPNMDKSQFHFTIGANLGEL